MLISSTNLNIKCQNMRSSASGAEKGRNLVDVCHHILSILSSQPCKQRYVCSVVAIYSTTRHLLDGSCRMVFPVTSQLWRGAPHVLHDVSSLFLTLTASLDRPLQRTTIGHHCILALYDSHSRTSGRCSFSSNHPDTTQLCIPKCIVKSLASSLFNGELTTRYSGNKMDSTYSASPSLLSPSHYPPTEVWSLRRPACYRPLIYLLTDVVSVYVLFGAFLLHAPYILPLLATQTL